MLKAVPFHLPFNGIEFSSVGGAFHANSGAFKEEDRLQAGGRVKTENRWACLFRLQVYGRVSRLQVGRRVCTCSDMDQRRVANISEQVYFYKNSIINF